MYGTQGHPLTKWRLSQDPPWPVTYLAKRLGTTMPWLSKITSNKTSHRATPELAFAIEILTEGEIKMIDLLLEKNKQSEIRKRIKNGS